MLRIEAKLIDTTTAEGSLVRSASLDDSSCMTYEEILTMGKIYSDGKQAYESGGTWAHAYWRTIYGDIIQEISGGVGHKLRRSKLEIGAYMSCGRTWDEMQIMTGST